MKKLIALLLAAVMVLSLAAYGAETTPAAASAPDDAAANTPATDTAEAGSEERERVTITIGVVQLPNIEDYETNALTKWWEEQLNIDLEFTCFSSDSSEASTQLALMAAGGEEMPDLLWGMDIGTTAINEYGNDGYFVDLMPYLNEEHMPNFWAAVNAEGIDPSVKTNLFTYLKDPDSGAMYGFPSYQVSLPDTVLGMMFINHEWLDAVGMEMPTTTEELYEVLKAFVEQDPNGNGEKDEIGIFSNNSYRSDCIKLLLNCFVYIHDTYFWNVTDGQLWAPQITDEYRQALIYLNKLCTEGLLDESSFNSWDAAAVYPYFTPADGEAIVGVIGAYPILSADPTSNVQRQYSPLLISEDVTGKGGWGPFYDGSYWSATVITADCEPEKIDRVIELVDLMYTEESLMRMRFGAEGSGWAYLAEGEEGVDSAGNPATFKMLADKYATQNNETFALMSCVILNYANVHRLAETESGAGFNDYLSNAFAVALRTVGEPDELVRTLAYTAEENEVVSEVRSPVREYVASQRALFVSGALDPNNDADWQAYLDGIEQQGLSRWQAVAQAAYSRQNG